MTICNLIKTFPVLLILAQKHNRCLETHFVYKPPSPTQSPEYYQALDALFQSLYGHGYPSHSDHDSHNQPCYSYSKKYGNKPCYGYQGHGYHYAAPSTPFGSHGTGYGLSPSYGSHNTGYGSHGTSYGSPGTYYVPGYKKGNIYDGNVTYGHGYAATQGYTVNNRYKIVVKKTRIGNKAKRKSG